jgi:hypothetical protein
LNSGDAWCGWTTSNASSASKDWPSRERDDPETVRICGALARYIQEIDQPEIAARMFADLLDDCRRVLGPDHPDTLMVRRQSSIQVARAGDPRRALDLFAELLADHFRLYGSDHWEPSAPGTCGPSGPAGPATQPTRSRC